jgi:hypothetical protein
MPASEFHLHRLCVQCNGKVPMSPARPRPTANIQYHTAHSTQRPPQAPPVLNKHPAPRTPHTYLGS